MILVTANADNRFARLVEYFLVESTFPELCPGEFMAAYQWATTVILSSGSRGAGPRAVAAQQAVGWGSTW